MTNITVGELEVELDEAMAAYCERSERKEASYVQQLLESYKEQVNILKSEMERKNQMIAMLLEGNQSIVQLRPNIFRRNQFDAPKHLERLENHNMHNDGISFSKGTPCNIKMMFSKGTQVYLTKGMNDKATQVSLDQWKYIDPKTGSISFRHR